MKAALILLALLCAGCENHTYMYREGVQPYVYRDQLTGCEYLAPDSQHGAMTPRMGADGKQICGAKP